MNEILSHTESVCPECLARIPAARVMYHGGDVYLEKDCPDHGHFKTIIWRGLPAFTSWVKPKTPTYSKNPFTEVKRGCPYDCGLCAEHKQQSCCVLLEVTQRCDLHCPVCFADAANNPPADLPHEEINAWYERLLLAGGPFNIQLSGGEPCVRNDLPEIIKIGRSHGFNFFQLNTNGLRIARDFEYLSALKEAGLSTFFLQFDGTRDEIFKTIRGRELLEKKMAVIENCGKLNIGVVLVPTLVPNVNTDNIGDMLRLALANMPTVRGVHFQPVSYFGRYPQGFPETPTDDMRITIPEVIQSIESQTDGLIQAGTLCPPGGENALCSFHGNYVLMADGALKPLTRHKEDSCCCQPIPAAEGASRSREFVAAHWSSPAPLADLPVISAPSFGEWDVFLERKRTHTFCVSGMAFQDAWTLDLDRLRECYIHTASPDGRLVPFCAYNLTDKYGRSLYRNTILKVEGQKLQVGGLTEMQLTPLDPWITQKTNGIDLQTWQLAKLNETLALVRARSSFYKKLFTGMPESILSLDELRKFPFTTPEDIRQNPLGFVCVSQDEIQRVVTLQSSGTTGEPKRIFFTADDQELTIDFFGVGMSTLVEAGERVLIFLPGETPGSVGDLLRMGLERKGAHPIPYGMAKDPFYALDMMEKEQADCLVGSPTQILSLARRWNPIHKAPRTILLSTDYVPAAIVSVLENTWGCKVFNHYGATEMGLGGGVECEAHRGFHLREADMYFEIVNPETGEPVPDGEYGEVVFSTLTRRGMPLLRYRMGDRSRFVVGECPCGTKLRTLEKVRGRFSGFVSVGDEILKLPDFDEALFSLSGLLNFSVTVSGSAGDEALLIDAQMLTDKDSTREVEKALESVSSIKKIVRCHHNPNEVGSLLKRIIMDKRGQNA